jgi:MFS family permease
MNEPPVSPVADFKDRRGGLIGFGILVIIIGCICALLVPLMFFSLTMSARTTGRTTDFRTIVPAAMLYGAMAVTFVWLGIGSIMTRRWARALLLILAWLWLLMGVFMIGGMAIVLPMAFAHSSPGGQSLPDGMRIVMMIFMLGFMTVAFVILPGLLVLFYRSRHVKATCEARDPVIRWTDACPLPVLALSLLLGFGALSMLPMMLVYHSVMPFFGRFLSGLPGTMLLLVMLALWCYCAWATYKLKLAGWWVLFVSFGVLMVSCLITYAQADFMDMYRLMGYPQQQIEQIQQYNFFKGHNLVWVTVLSMVPFFGYLLYVKRYFRRPA